MKSQAFITTRNHEADAAHLNAQGLHVTVEAAGLNAPTSSTVLRVTSPKNTESVICSVFSPAWARALAPEGATAKAPTLEQWMQYC